MGSDHKELFALHWRGEHMTLQERETNTETVSKECKGWAVCEHTWNMNLEVLETAGNFWRGAGLQQRSVQRFISICESAASVLSFCHDGEFGLVKIVLHII